MSTVKFITKTSKCGKYQIKLSSGFFVKTLKYVIVIVTKLKNKHLLIGNLY